jgi:hypothetical protein
LFAFIGFSLALAMRWRLLIAGDRGQMASRRLPFILAMEIESAGWQANSSVGDTQAYPRDEHCQSAVELSRKLGDDGVR